MMRNAALLALVPTVVAFSAFNGNGNFLGNDMRPDVVAHTLMRVEDGWMHQATKFAHCTAEGGEYSVCEQSEQSFSKSCVQVVNGIVQGSAGDRERTAEYMSDVCGQNALSGWHQATCLSLRKVLGEKMTQSAFDNRESLKTAKICEVAWSALVKEQKEEVVKELAWRKEQEKKEQEEEAKEAAKEVEEQKAAEKKAADDAIKKAREAAEQAEVEEKKVKQEEESREKEEKKVEKVEDANFQKTKKEIEDVERAAEQKMEEATEVEHEDVSAATPAKDAKVEVKTPEKVASVPKEASQPIPAPASAKPAVAKPAVAPKPARLNAPAVKKVEAKPAVTAKEAKPAVAKEAKPAVKVSKV